MTKPKVTATTHLLPFALLSPTDFERLCYWLITKSGQYEKAEHLGAAGSEEGRDIIAWRDGDLYAFQCKRVRSLGARLVRVEIEKLSGLQSVARPKHIVFLASCNISAKTRSAGQLVSRSYGFSCEFVGQSELDSWTKQYPDLVAEFFNTPFSEQVPASRPFRVIVEIIKDHTSKVMNNILKDLRKVVLVKKPIARVLINSSAISVSDSGKSFTNAAETVHAVREALSHSTNNARRIFEWSDLVSNGLHLSIFLTSLGKSVFLYQIYRDTEFATPDLRKGVPNLLKEREDFTPFPSLYDDILTSLQLHTDGGLLPSLHFYGYHQAIVPITLQSSSRLLVSLAERLAGSNKPLRMSELAMTSGRTILALEDMTLLFQLWVLPIGSFDDLMPLLDFVTLFFHQYLGASGLSSHYQKAVVDNLERIARLIRSVPLSGGGVFEDMIADLRRRMAQVTVNEREPDVSREFSPAATIDDFAEHIRTEFAAVTQVDLTSPEIDIERKTRCTRVIFRMEFPPDANPKTRSFRSDNFDSLMQELAACVAKKEHKERKQIHSVCYSPFLLTDGVVFIVKVNWSSYNGENSVTLFDF